MRLTGSDLKEVIVDTERNSKKNRIDGTKRLCQDRRLMVRWQGRKRAPIVVPAGSRTETKGHVLDKLCCCFSGTPTPTGGECFLRPSKFCLFFIFSVPGAVSTISVIGRKQSIWI